MRQAAPSRWLRRGGNSCRVCWWVRPPPAARGKTAMMALPDAATPDGPAAGQDRHRSRRARQHRHRGVAARDGQRHARLGRRVGSDPPRRRRLRGRARRTATTRGSRFFETADAVRRPPAHRGGDPPGRAAERRRADQDRGPDGGRRAGRPRPLPPRARHRHDRHRAAAQQAERDAGRPSARARWSRCRAAKESGVIRAHGVSCHTLSRRCSSRRATPWVDVDLARINPAGHHRWTADPATVISVLRQMKAAGKGVIGMKILGEGQLGNAVDRAITHAVGAGRHRRVHHRLHQQHPARSGDAEDRRRLIGKPALSCRTWRPGVRAQAHEPADPRDQPVPAAARAQPGRLAPVGRRGVRRGAPPGQAGVPVDRLLDLPLVPRHGGGVVRGRGDRRAR